MVELPWSSASIVLKEISPARQIGLRLRAPFPAYLAGVPVPLAANRVAATGAVRVLWLGADEWLVVAEGDAPDLLPRLERAVTGRRSAICDLSSSRTIIQIGGSAARGLLASGCGLDLHPRAFGPGQCAQTLLVRVPVILDQLDEASHYRLLVRRSFSRWLVDWMIDAAEVLTRRCGRCERCPASAVVSRRWRCRVRLPALLLVGRECGLRHAGAGGQAPPRRHWFRGRG